MLVLLLALLSLSISATVLLFVLPRVRPPLAPTVEEPTPFDCDAYRASVVRLVVVPPGDRD